MTLKDDVVAMGGEKLWKELQCVKHSKVEPPEDEDHRVMFRLLEMVDWECPAYGDSHGLTMDQTKELIMKNRAVAMECPATSALGLLAGTFDFLTE